MEKRNPSGNKPHVETHRNDGDDELNVDGLSGVLADKQDADKLQGVNLEAAAASKDDIWKFDGTQFRLVPEGTSFVFSIFSFTDGISTIVEIGTGTWKAIGDIDFTAVYTNGPATSGLVSMSGFGNAWGSDLDMGSPFTGPTPNSAEVDYPASPGTASFSLLASDGSTSPSRAKSHNFWNHRFWGLTTKASGYTEADIEGLSGDELSNSKSKTFTETAGASDYIVYVVPVRLGDPEFTVGGFSGGFDYTEVVSVTNDSGYVEDYKIFRSDNTNLGETTVDAS